MAKKAFLTSGKAYRKIKKQYITDNGVYRRVKKIYETVDGVYVLRWTGGDTWKKYKASKYHNGYYYLQDQTGVGYTYTDSGAYYGNPATITLYRTFSFSESSGFYGTSELTGGGFRVDSENVWLFKGFAVDEEKSTETNIYARATWERYAHATQYSYGYTYSKGEYIEDIETDEGQLPTTSTPEATEDDGNRIYVYENNAWYCYEKVVEEPEHEATPAVLDEAILDYAYLL